MKRLRTHSQLQPRHPNWSSHLPHLHLPLLLPLLPLLHLSKRQPQRNRSASVRSPFRTAPSPSLTIICRSSSPPPSSTWAGGSAACHQRIQNLPTWTCAATLKTIHRSRSPARSIPCAMTCLLI